MLIEDYMSLIPEQDGVRRPSQTETQSLLSWLPLKIHPFSLDSQTFKCQN